MGTSWANDYPSFADTTNEQASGEKSIDDWLPVTSSRKAKWWYSAFQNVNAIIGAGVLGLPYAMSKLGWGLGISVLIISWVVTLYTLWQLARMHEAVPGKRFDRYHELGQHAFGEKLGLWIVVPQQLLVQVSVNIMYMVTGGESLKRFHDLVCPMPRCKPIRAPYFIFIFGSAHFVLSQLPNFNSIWAVSLVGAVMSVSYSTVAWAASLSHGTQEEMDCGYHKKSTTKAAFNLLYAFGTVAYAHAGHSVAQEIQATIPSTPEKPSMKPMWKGIVTTYAIVALCYFPVAIVGYWAFGKAVEEDILVSLCISKKPRWVIAMANMMVAVHLIGGYQVYAMPVFDLIEGLLTKKLRLPPGFTLRLISRSTYVAFTMFSAISFPFLRSLLGFFGGLALAPNSYFMPCIMWLAIYKPRRYSLSWFTNWICIILGVVLIILSAIGGLPRITLHS